MRAKAIFKRMNGTQEPLVAGYLDEVMWRERYGGSVARTLRNILLHMRERNPCLKISIDDKLMTNLIQIDTNKNKQCTTHKIRTPTFFFRQFFNFYYRLSKMQSYCCEVGQQPDRRVLESVRKAERKGAPN